MFLTKVTSLPRPLLPPPGTSSQGLPDPQLFLLPKSALRFLLEPYRLSDVRLPTVYASTIRLGFLQ